MTVSSVPDTFHTDRHLAVQFAREAEPHFEVLSRGARRLTRNAADAEDLLQDTLLHAYAGFHTFQEGSNLRAWLFRILYNRWVSTHRAKQSRPAEVLVRRYHRAGRAARARQKQRCSGCVARQRNQGGIRRAARGFREAVYYADIRDTPTPKPPRSSVSRWALSCRGRRGAGSGCAPHWLTSRPPPPTNHSSRKTVTCNGIGIQNALITGGTAGIGLACASLMAHEGATVIITGRDAERGKAAAAGINGSVRFIQADLADIDSVKSLVQQAGNVDILVNNAASFPAALTVDQEFGRSRKPSTPTSAAATS